MRDRQGSDAAGTFNGDDLSELNNNNNNKQILQLELSTSRSTSAESIDTTPKRQPSEVIGINTWRRRRIQKDSIRSLKQEDEFLGLENVIPRHKSPKALQEMGK